MQLIKNHFQLQATFAVRKCIEFGLHPMLAILVALIAFFAGSLALFNQTIYAPIIYSSIAISFLFNYTAIARNEFLKLIYTKNHFHFIRIIENQLIVLPFVLFLVYKASFIAVLLIVSTATAMAFITIKNNFQQYLPTPFYKKPFEFIVGFRIYVGGFIVAYFIVAMSIINQNFNLGIAGQLLSFLICLAFYSTPEDSFYVWIHQYTVRQFLFHKTSIALLHSSFITLPLMALLLMYYPENFIIIIGCQLIGYTYLTTMVFAKYANYPQQLHLPLSILLIVSMSFPPLLLFALPYFYAQSSKQLKNLLV